MVKKVLAALALSSLVACGGTNTLTIVESLDDNGNPVTTTEYDLTDTGIYHKSIADSTKDKRLLAEKQAEEIRNVDISTQSSDAQALLNREKIESIGSIATTSYEGTAPTTVADVAKGVVGIVPSVVTSTIQGVALVETGKTLRTALDKDTVVVKNSKDTSVSLIDEDNDQTQVATANEGGATNAPQSRGSDGTGDASDPSSSSSSNLGEDSAIIAACKDSHAGTTFACVNERLGENKYGVVGNDITMNGSNWYTVDSFEK